MEELHSSDRVLEAILLIPVKTCKIAWDLLQRYDSGNLIISHCVLFLGSIEFN